MITLIRRRLQIHFLYGLLLFLNLLLDQLHLVGYLLYEPLHNGIFLIQPNKDIQQLPALILDSHLPNADFLPDPVKTLLYLLFLHDALLVFEVDTGVLFSLDLDLLLVFLYLLLEFLQMLLLHEFRLDKLLEPDIVLNFIVELGTVLPELLFLLLSLFLQMPQIILSLVPRTVCLPRRLYRIFNIFLLLLQLLLEFDINVLHRILLFT